MGNFQNILIKNAKTAAECINGDYNKLKVMHHILKCHTKDMGMNEVSCPECGYHELHYNSCRDRNCPECQYGKCQEWVDTYKESIIDGIEYFHIVFTLPGELNSLILCNQRELYKLMFTSASQALLKSGKKDYGKLGFTLILHSWSSSMVFHPHLHCIAAGGGLKEDRKSKQSEFVMAPKGDKAFFISVYKISDLFKKIFLDGLKELHSKLCFSDQDKDLAYDSPFESFLSSLYDKKWVVFSKPTFENTDAVVNYIGRYTHRIAISNSRIKNYDEENGTVTFTYNDYKDREHLKKDMTLSVREFLRRFFMHVLPGHFIKIRHYGFMSNASRKKLVDKCRKLIAEKKDNEKKENLNDGREDTPKKAKRPSKPHKSAKSSSHTCPKCGKESLHFHMISFRAAPT